MTMHARTIRTYKTVHTWSGIVSALALFIAFYAGAITMFNEAVARWVAPPEEQDSLAPLAAMPELMDHLFRQRPELARRFNLFLPEGNPEQALLQWEERTGSGSARTWRASLTTSGELRISQESRSGLAEFINRIHQTAGVPLPGEGGVTFMGIVSGLYALALISGLIVLLPSLVKDLFLLRLGKNLKRMWLDMHNVVGLFSLPFHMVMALTAIMLGLITVPAFNSVYTAAVFEGSQQAAFKQAHRRFAPTAGTLDDAAPMLAPAQLLAAVQRLAPTFEVRQMMFINEGKGHAQVRVVGLVRESLSWGAAATLDASTGHLISGNMLPGTQDTWWAVLGSFVGLHFGYYGGELVRWGYFLLGLAGAWLFYSGNLLWLETRRKAQRKSDKSAELPLQRPDARWLACGTVGVCLGCMAGLSLTIVTGKWLHGHVQDLDAWHHYVYYAVFLVSIAWAFARGAARASVELSWLLAAFTLAIPMTTLLAWLLPSTGLWVHTSASALGVDATAFVAASCFAWMARATARRAKHGPADSVWSIRSPGNTKGP